MKAKHTNIVRFLGYFSGTRGEMLGCQGELVMEYVRHKLLCSEITDLSHGLEWTKRYEITSGICDGLYYLHQNHIVKPTNILLDATMMPKITDFGLSRCFDEKQFRVITSKLIGTLGYIEPEFYACGHITFKSDMYSLGVIIIEALTREKRYQ